MTRVIIYSTGADGHHPEYDAVIARELAAIGVEAVFTKEVAVALTAPRVLFAMIDGNWRAFVLCALASCVSARRVSGLFFRPGECFRPAAKYKFKRLAMRALRAAPRTKVVSIVPFSASPRLAEVAWDWVPDPQMWDLGDETGGGCSTPLSAELVARAGGRPIVVALGEQNASKGFRSFCGVWSASAELRERRLFVAAGRVAPHLRAQAEVLRRLGGVVIDRRLSFDEMASLYRAAGMVWAVYHPNYDQASGIVGRAFQFGVPTILRRGSFMASVMREWEHPIVEVDYGAPHEAARRILAYDVPQRLTPPVEAIAAMRRRFIRTIARALNVEASDEGGASKPAVGLWRRSA